MMRPLFFRSGPRSAPAPLAAAFLLALLLSPGRAGAQTPQPTGTAATAAGGSVALSWNPAPGAFSYNVYRATAAGAEGATPLATGITGSTFYQDAYTDSTAVNGTTYYYTVTTEDISGESVFSKEVAATPGAAPLAAPSLTASPQPAQVVLTWTAIAGATSYNLYRSTDNNNYQCYLKALAGPTFPDTNVVSGTVYYYRVYPVGPAGQGTASNTIAATPGGYAPSAPTGLGAYGNNGSVSLYWAGSPGATSYNVYRATTPGGEGASPYVTGVGGSYNDSGVTNGTTYYYQVSAVDANGESGLSNESPATPGSVQLPAPVLALTPGASQIVARWSAVTGATGYLLYRSTDNSSFVQVGPKLAATTYTDTGLTAGVTYYYEVAADSSAGEGVVSAHAAATPGAAMLPAPAGVYAFPENTTQVGIRWNPVPGASSYNVYRSTTAGGEGTVPFATGVTSINAGAYYFDSGSLTTGTPYYFTVTAVGSAESAQSAEVSATPGGANPAPPTLTAAAGTGQVVLNWGAVAGATGYNLRRSTDNSSYPNVKVGLAGTTFTDTGLTAGITYYYVLDAVNVNGQSGDSNTVSATPGASALPAPGGLQAYPIPGYTNANTLRWSPVPGASSYNVYRSTTAGGEGAVPYVTNLTTVTSGELYYNDFSLTTGTAYFYTVTAVNGSSQSAPSAEASATPGGTVVLAPLLTAAPGAAQVVLNWSAVPGAATYSVYRCTDNASFLQIKNGLAGTTTTDTAVTNGVTYYYVVTAVTAVGQSGGSNTVSATPGFTGLAAPTGLLAYPNGAAALYVRWNPVPGASSYDVYRSLTPGGEGAAPYAVNVTTLNYGTGYFYDSGLASGTTYYYTVTAVTGSSQGAPSGETSATPGGTVPGTPVLSAASSPTQIVLNWSVPAGATSYDVYRSTDNYNFSYYRTGLTATTYTDTAVTPGVPLYYIVVGVNTAGVGPNSNTVSATAGITALLAPTDPRTDPGTNVNTLYWNPAAGGNAYNVYRSTTPGGEGAAPYVAGVTSSNRLGFYYTDYGVTNGTKYYYKITTVGPAGESAPSAETSGTPGTAALVAPSLAAGVSGATVKLTWTAITNATGYNVYRATDNYNFTVVAANAAGTTYTDAAVTPGVLYYYYVVAVNTAGELSTSNTASAQVGTGTLAAPVNPRTDPGNGVNTLYWNPVVGATSYNVYRSTTAGGEGTTPYVAGVTSSNRFGAYSSDSGVTNGTTYYYKITTVSPAGESAPSAETSGTPGTATLTTPSLVANVLGAAIKLTWTAITGATSYNVYRSTDNSTFTVVATSVTGTTYTDAAVTAGVTYYYYVNTVNAAGELSTSNTANAQITGTLPAPTAVRGAPINGSQNFIAWNPVIGATSYNVYRSITPGGEGTTAYATGVTSSSQNSYFYYYDSGATAGTTYYYKIATVNSTGAGAQSLEIAIQTGSSRAAGPTLAAVPGSSQVVLTWTPVAGATSYGIYRCTDNVNFQGIKTGLTGTTFTDTGLTNGVTYYYLVESTEATGEGNASSTVSAVPSASVLAAPVGIRAFPNSPGASYVYWNPVVGATSYNLYRSTTPGGEGTAPFATGITSVGVAGVYTYDNTETAGTTYYYKVAAVSSAGAGAQSAEAGVKSGSARAAGPTTTAIPGAGQVTLAWSAVPGAVTYQVYRSTDNSTYLNVKTGLTGTAYVDTGLTAGVPYYYQVDSIEATGEGNVGNTVSAVPGATALSAPTGVRASLYAGSYLTVSWNAVPGASSYNVYRGLSAGGEGATPYATGVTSASNFGYYLTDTSVTSGVPYFYTVVAVDGYAQSGPSAEVSGTPGSAPLAAPVVSAAAGNAQVVLTWSAIPGASGYNVERGTDGTNFVKIVTGQAGTTLTDAGLTNGVTYYYIVDAVAATGEGNNSTTVSATPLATAVAQPAPSKLTAASPDGSDVTLRWAPAPGAASYDVFRGLAAGAEGTAPYAAGVTAPAYTDSGAAYGTTYYYKVAAAGLAGLSGLSNEASATPGGAPLSAPVLTDALVASPLSVTLTWSAVPGATGYNVYRSTDSYNYTPLASASAAVTYSDAAVSAGVTYYYVVEAENADGEGAGSNVVTATPGVAVLPAPTGLAATVNGANSNSLTWNPVVGATSYNVYRGLAANGEGLAPYFPNVSGAASSYIDYGVAVGTAYYYKVSAVSRASESLRSNEAHATGGQTPLPAPLLKAVPGSGLVTLTWSKVPGATSYNLYRSVDNSSFVSVLFATTALGYANTGLTAGVTYYYRVAAVGLGGQGSLSASASAMPLGSVLPAPGALRATQGNTVVYLNWNPVVGATAYNVYRSTAKAGEGTTPYSTNVSTSYNDYAVTNGIPYYYVVTAVSGGGEGARSNEAQAVPGSRYLAAPNLAVTPGNGSATLRWNPIAGATGYNVHLNTGAGLNVIAPGVTSTVYTATGLTNGAPATFLVAAFGRYGQGYGSNQVTVTPGSTPLRAPQLGAQGGAQGGSNYVTLSWTPVSGATYYNLYRATTPGAEAGMPYVTGLATNGASALIYQDTAVSTGVTYYYQVATGDSQGQGALSNEAAAKPPTAGSQDFLLFSTPDTLTVVRGSDVPITISLAPISGFNGNVTLTVSGLPAGVTAGFFPAVATVSGSTLTLSLGASATPGAYTLSVTGVSGTVTHTTPIALTILASAVSNVVRVSGHPSELSPNLSLGAPLKGDRNCGRGKHASLPHSSLLNDVGNLDKPVAPSEVAAWKAELHARTARAADLTLWLGEYALAHDQDPSGALRRFHQVWSLSRDPEARSRAAWDAALARFYAGAYADAADSFHDVLLSSRPAAGFDRQTASMWWRRAGACAGYHAQRAALGIPEPTRLDPECGVAALAAGLRTLGLPYGRARLHAACRVTGEGSSLADLIAAGPKLGIVVRPVSADETGLQMLPKPLVAYVEHDHFIAVVKADPSGVSYLCSDCGPWPGGRVNLTWAQWRQLNATRFGVMTVPGSAWDRKMAQAEGLAADPLHASLPATLRPIRVAAGLGAAHLLPGRAVRSLLRHVVVNYIGPGGLSCGDKPNAPPCPPETCCPDDGGGPGGGGGGPSGGDPVNLATGEEEYNPAPDLRVYNPRGPALAWKRVYRSLRGSFFSSATEFNDFGSGWSQTYNVGVYDPTNGGAGVKYVFYADGSRDTFSAPSVPTAGTPVVACATTPGESLLVEWDYDARRPGGFYRITFPSRTQWVTTAYDSAVGCCLLSQIVDRAGNAIKFNYGAPVDSRQWPLLRTITDALGNTLLTVNRTVDGTGNITSVTDAYARAIAYHVGFYPTTHVPNGYPQSVRLVDHVSQVQPVHAVSPSDRWALGYSQVRNTEGLETVPFLTAISVPSPAGTGYSTATIQYDPATDFITALTDANGNTRTYTQVDVNGNPSPYSNYTQVQVTDSTGAVNSSYTVNFDGHMNTTGRVNGANQTVATRAFSDPNDPYRPSSVTDGNGHVSQFTYDQFGNVLSATSPRTTLTTNTYVYTSFALGEETQTATGAKSPTATTYYEPSGLVHTLVAPLPGTTGSASVATTTFSYDFTSQGGHGLGHVTSIVTPGNATAATLTTTFGYGPTPSLGLPLTVTDNLGHTRQSTYDARGNRTGTIDAIGLETDTTYDLADSPLQTLDPATVTGGGRAGQILAYLYPGGPKITETHFDESGATVRRISYAYGPESELLGRSGSAEPVTYAYDGLYRMTALTDGGGHATHYFYNAAGYLAAVTAPGYAGPAYPAVAGPDSVQFPSHDALGNVLQRVDGNGRTTTFAYADPESSLTDVTYPAGTLAPVHFTYDAYGRRSGASNGTGSATSSYDDVDGLLSAVTTYTGLAAKTLSYTYNADGSRKTMVTPAGTYTSAYDGAGRLTGLTTPYGEPAAWTYLNNNVLKTQALGNAASTAVATTTYTYNARLFLTDQLTQGVAGTLSEFGSTDPAHPENRMQYDAVGGRTQIKAALSAGGSLLAGPYTGTTTYVYDAGQTANPALNRSQVTSETNGTGTTAYAYDGGAGGGPGDPTTFRGAAVAYNADNQITGAGFAYDGDGNPTTYRGSALTYDVENRLTGLGSLLTAAYTPDGLRAWKQGASGRTYFLYDGSAPVCELSTAGAVTAASTFGINGLVSRHVGAVTTFYTWDPSGNAAQTLNSAGAVTNSFHFDAFGARTSTSASADPYTGFGGRVGGYTDSETGLTLMTLRYYDSATGRFLTRDPIGYAGGINVYAFTRNDPVNFTDPLGTEPDPCNKPKPNHCARDLALCVGHAQNQAQILIAAATATTVVAIAVCGFTTAGIGLPICLAGALALEAIADASILAVENDQINACNETYKNCLSDASE